MNTRSLRALLGAALLFATVAAWGQGTVLPALADVRQVEQYNFSIHILAMLLVGFGFLMVFVKKYGYSATTGTYLVVAVGIPLYMFLRASGVIPGEKITAGTVESLLFAEFAAASGLIAMGAVLGRIRLYQYALLALLLVPAYLLNEWLVLNNGLGLTKGFVDAAGSIIIHAFGAYFGLGLAIILTNRRHLGLSIDSDATSDRFAMLGSMVLWLFWPSFCSAIVPHAQVQATLVNTVLALSGATVSTFIFSSLFRKGKVSIADMANAALAGGVSIGATCNIVAPGVAFVIGLLAGTLCTIGYVFIQPKLEAKLHLVDTCGVHNLHGMPGLLGGLIAIVVVPGIATPQLIGIVITVAIALITGIIGGVIIKVTGQKQSAYEDDEFLGAEPSVELPSVTEQLA
ncbi:MAG TPA: ammonium transporter [Armatimonadota bacterium]|nr:ammonium transporter [Armatimonadota bacterium]